MTTGTAGQGRWPAGAACGAGRAEGVEEVSRSRCVVRPRVHSLRSPTTRRGRGELRAGEDLFAEQHAGLAAALVEAGAKVDVEDVEELWAELDVGLERATLFAA